MNNKYIITGQIELLSALHIGSGYMSHETDATIIRDGHDLPVIPGSSLKGIIRTAAERLYYLIKEKNTKEVCFLGEDDCNRPKKQSVIDQYNELAKKMDETEIEKWINKNVCPICQLFGSNFKSSKVTIYDARLSKESEREEMITTVRHSVSIDRETGAAKEGAKFDFEVVNKGMFFDFQMELEDVSENELKLILIVLNEMKNERIQLGGNIARGLGKVKLINDEINEYKFVKDDMEEKSDKEMIQYKKDYLNYLVFGGKKKEQTPVTIMKKLTELIPQEK